MALWWCYVPSRSLCDGIAPALEMVGDSLHILPTAAVGGKMMGWRDVVVSDSPSCRPGRPVSRVLELMGHDRSRGSRL